MFYKVNGQLQEISIEDISDSALTVGYISPALLQDCYGRFGFEAADVESCKVDNKHFRSSVEIYEDYTFTDLRILNWEDRGATDDRLALFVKANLLLLICIDDSDGSTQKKFMNALKRVSEKKCCLEKLIASFLEQLISKDNIFIEDMIKEIAGQEEIVLSGRTAKDFNLTLLKTKNDLLAMENYYDQLLDITNAIMENENDIFNEDNMLYITNIDNKISRLSGDIKRLNSSLVHLQDAYTAFLDLQMNESMKIFTVITSVFFPLTIIVGWYGMNFKYMPELNWKYGYVYVIALSIAAVTALILIGKKKKWF